MNMTKKTLFFIVILCIISFRLMAQDVGISGDSTINQCETRSYTISILNNTTNPLTDFVITAKLENFTGFSYVSGTTSIASSDLGDNPPVSCTPDPTISGGYTGLCAPAPSPPYLTWDIDAQCGGPFTLDPGETLDITFSLATDCDAVSGSLNTLIDYAISGSPDCDDTGAHSIQVLPGGVTIKKTPNVIPEELYQNVTWTLTIENTGFGVIENVVVTDVLGDGLAYDSSSPAGVNSGQTTTWDLGNMNSGDTITIDITAQVIACENLDNNADVRWGCDAVTDCYNTADTIPPSTATASVQRIVKTPLLDFTPPDITFDYCQDYVDVSFPIENIKDGNAHDIWILVDFGSFTVSNISSGAVYNAAQSRFELNSPNPLPPGGSYNLSFRLNYSTWCGGSFPSGDLLWQNVYKDDCDQEFYPPVKLSTVNAPAGTSSLSVSKSGAPPVVQIGAQVNYTITSSYTGPLACGSSTTSDVTVVDTIPNGFSVETPIADGGVWVDSGDGTGGTITWTYTPPASLNTSLTLNVPDATQCETYCFTTFTNSVTANAVDCCGCALNDSSSQTTAIECEELVDSEKTAVPTTGIRCDNIRYTNTYVFADTPALDSVNLSQLIFQEDADNEQEYVPGSLAVTLSGSGDITACAQSGMTDTTPGAGGNLIINFSNCSTFGSVRNRTLTITYQLTITEATVGACSGATFYSWSNLDLNLTTGSECLPDGIIYETTPVSVDPPAMSLSVTGLGQIIHKCETQTITLTLTQTSGTADPKDVRLVLSGLNYYVVNPAATVCGGVAPVSCTPTIDGNGDYIWEFGDAFTGSGQSATLQINVQKRCTGSGDLVATTYFDDNCNDDATYDDTCSTTATETPALLLSGDLLIEKNPEVYYVATNTVEWKIYLTNRGTGTAYNVWLDDDLGAGLDYVSAVVDNMTGVTVTADQDHVGNAINGATIAIARMTAGERREITFQALLIDCNDLTNDVSTSWGCIGVECQAVVTDSSVVEIPRPLLINTNVVTTPADACSDPTGSITLRNAGQTTCYDLQITENLPDGLNYIPGTTRWSLDGVVWNGPDAKYDPVVSGTPEQLDWSSTAIGDLAVSNPGDTIEIRFDMHADCPFTGGDVTVATSYKNPCGEIFYTANSVFTVAFRAPTITVTKTALNEPIDCGDLVEWTITVANTSGYTLPIIWVEDTLGAAYTFQSSEGDPPFNSDNGTFDGTNTVTWELRNVNHNDVVNLTIRANADNPPCSASLDNSVIAWWGCGAADGSSGTKPGEDPPDDSLCLSTAGISTTNTPTREPTIGFLDITVDPVSLDSCNDNTQLTVTIQNTGPTDAENVDLVITLPAGITYNAGSSTVTCGGVTNPAADPTPSGNQLIYYDITDNATGKADNICDTVEAFNGNDTVVLVFSVRSNCYVTAGMGFDLYYYDCCEDTQYSTNDSETIEALYPDLEVTKIPVDSQVDCNSNQTWTITVTNNGTGNAQVVRIEDTLGDWIDYISSTPAATPMGGQVYGWEISNLAPGNSQVFTITGQLNPDAPQSDCTALLRQNNVRAIWGCGTNVPATDGNPTTQGYSCTYTDWTDAPAATLQMPDLLVTGITPVVTCNTDGSFSGSITVSVQNQGDGNSVNDFTVEITDGKGWTGTGTHSGNIAPGSSVDVTIDVSSWTPDCQPCAAPYTFNVTNVDLGDAVCECNEGNNSFGPVNYITPIPDLVISDIDFTNVSCTNDNISGGVSVVVTNTGCATANNFQVSLTTDGCLNFSNQTVIALAAGASISMTFPISGSWSDCTVEDCEFTAEVDPTDVVCECDGTNNDRIENYTTTLPDLVVTDIDFSNISCAFDNFSGFVSVTVQNQGFGSAVGFQVSLNTDGCLSFGNQTVLVPVGAGASTTVNFPIAPPWVNCADCTCQYTAVVDATNVVCECDGTNNQYSENYTQNLPDLRINSVTPAVACVSDGNLQGTVTVNVENIGCGDANNVVVRLISTCGIVFVDQIVNLPASASTNLTFNFTPGCFNCTCIFIALIDPNNLICECSGTNNAMVSVPYTINVPDITVPSDTLTITCSGSQQVTVSGTVTLANPGCGLLFNASIPMRFTVYDNTGCTGSVLDQWTQDFFPAIIFPGGGTQAFAITPRTINTNLCNNSTNCQVSIRMEADYSSTICECDGTNNTRCANKPVDIPDLEVLSDTLGVTCLSDGQVTVSGNVTLANNGCGSNLTSNIPMRFTLYDNTGCGGSVVNQWTQTFAAANIPANGGTQVFTITPHNITTNLVTNSTACQVSLRVEADYTNAVCECDDTDNTYCADNKAVDIPDLEVSSDTLGISCLDDGQVTVSGTVTMSNNGCGSNLNANIPVRFTLYDNINCTGNQVAQWTETLAGVNIPAGGGTQVFTITPEDITTNTCTNSTGCQVSIRVEADYNNTICESDGMDNNRCSNKTVSVPDLTINSVTPSFTCVGDGNLQGAVTVNVENIGCGDVVGAIIRLTSDCGITFPDQTVNLAAGANTDVIFNYTPACTACTCTFTAAVDPGAALCECDGINNTLSSAPFTMTAPDIEVQADTLAITCSDDGQTTISGTVTLLNNGCGANLTADIPMRFTLRDNTGCSGNQLNQWTQTFTGVNIPSGGGSQVFTITPVMVTADLCTNSTNCQVSIQVEADYNDSICECDGTDNTYCADNKSVDIPDLGVQADTLGVSCVSDGQVSVAGTVTLTNTGCGSNLTADIPVRFTLYDNTGCGGNQLLQWTQTFTGVNIPSGGGTQAFTITAQNLNTNLVNNSTNCQVSILVEPDYTGTICECDGTNNNYCADNKPVDIPDLEAQSEALTINCTDDGQAQVVGTVTIVNTGCGSNLTANIPVRFTLFDSTGCSGNQLFQWTETFSSVNIPAGGGTQTFSVTPYNMSADLCTASTNCRMSIFVEVDYNNSICESDGTDNTICGDKNWNFPDLTINSVASTVICNSDGSLDGTTVNVSNTGCADANGVVVRLISDCGLTFSDQTVNLAAGETRDVFFPFTAGITTCNCNFTATIDPDNTICECDGSNNTRISPQSMLIPDLEVQAETLQVTCADDGVIRVSGSVTLVNNGCGPDFTGNIPMRFTLFGNTGCSGNRIDRWTQTFNGGVIAPAGGTQTFNIQGHDIAANFCTSSTNCQVSILIEADYNNTICEWDGTDNTYCTNKTSDCLDLEAATVTANTNCAEDAELNGTIAVTVRSSGGNPITQDFYIRVDDGEGWSSELLYNADLGGTLPLAAGASSTVTFQWNRTFENSTCEYTTITAHVDSQNNICQCTTENDTTSNSYQMPLSNLKPTAIVPGCSSDGNYLVRVTIENNGCSDAGQFTVHLEDNQGNSKDLTVESLAKNSSTTVDFTEWPVSCEPAANTFTAVVDFNNEVCEITGTDNSMEKVHNNTSPDLLITDVKPSATCRAPGDISGAFAITLQNNGNGPASQDFKVIVNDGEGWSTELFYQADLNGTLPIGAGETVNLRVNWNRNFTKEPFKCNFNNITVGLDMQNNLCECAAGNNETFTSYRLPYPDLVLQSLLPICSQDGLRQLRLTIGNNGCEDQREDFNIIFSDNRGATRTASFTSMGGTLPVKKGSPQTVTLADWEFDCTGTTTNYTAVIDHEGGGCDLLAENNTLELTHSMEEPDLLFGDITWTCNVDGTITFTVTAANNGNSDASNIPVHIYDGTGNLFHSRTIDLARGAETSFTFTSGVYPLGQNMVFRFIVDESDQFCECNGSNNEKSTTIRCEGGEEPQLKISKFCPPGQQPGGVFRFEIQLENTGQTELSNVRIEDFLPEGFQYVSGSSALDGQAAPDPQINDNLVTWTIGSLVAGETKTLVFSAVADADIDPGRYCNEVQAMAGVSGETMVVTSERVQCCTVVTRQVGAGCCLKVEEWALEPGQIPDGPLSFIEPYFHTETAMFTVYSIFKLWQGTELEPGTMPQFMKERLRNYARSTMEEFYLGSRLGLTLPDGSLWLSYAGAYPEKGNSWVRKQVDETMTASQIGFELLALNEILDIEGREQIKQKINRIIEKKITFLTFFIDDLPHAWEIEENKNKNKNKKEETKDDVKIEEVIEKFVKKQDEKATLYDRAALYLAVVNLEKSGYQNANIKSFKKKLEEMLKDIDNLQFDRSKLREEFLFTLALLETGQTNQARAKAREFEAILKKAAKQGEESQKEVLNTLHDYALAAAVVNRAEGTLYKELMKQMKEKYYLQDTGVFAEKQPDFTFKLNLHSLAPVILSFDNKDKIEQESNATVLYRIFDEVGLFLKKRNLSIGKPLYSLLKNYPFTEPLLPVLNFTKANRFIAPVFSRDAVIHSTQVKPIGEILIPQNFSKILSPTYDSNASRIAAVSFGLQYLGKALKKKNERVIKEEGRSFDETGKTYVESLLKSGAGIQLNGKTLLPYDNVAIKGPKLGEHNLEPINAGTGSKISTETLANYLLAEEKYVLGGGKDGDTVRQIMIFQDRIVKQFSNIGYLPEKFNIFIEKETEKITVIPSGEKASKITVAKFFHVLPRDDNHRFLESLLKETSGTLKPENLIFIASAPELVPYFEKEIRALVDYKDSNVSYNAADIIGRRLLGDSGAKIRESLENLKRHWDKEAVLPKSDLVENIERGLIYHHQPQQILLYLLATHEAMDFRFERTLNFFTYLLENEWGVAWNSFITLPSSEYQVFREEPKEHVEPGDLLTFRVRVDNTCPEGFGSALDLPSLYLKAAFAPSLIYAGTRGVDGLEVMGDFQWRYSGMLEGSVFEYFYQAIVPKDFVNNFIDGWIYAGGRQGFQEFGPESAVGDECEDIDQIGRLNFIPFDEIQGLVYEDKNVNGIKDVGERGIANILIKDTRGRLFRSNAEGRFTVLAGDEHEGVQIELKSIPGNYVMIENPTKLVNRHYTGEIHFGLIPCKTVTGFVYVDKNQDNAFQEDEALPEGVLIKARDKQVITGKNGTFIFRNLPVLWQQWIEIEKEQPYYQGSINILKIHVNEE